MYTEQELISFGNYMLNKFQVHTNHPTNETVLIPASVTDEDFNRWKEEVCTPGPDTAP